MDTRGNFYTASDTDGATTGTICVFSRRMRRWVLSRSWVVLFVSLAAAACSSKGGMASGRSGDECDAAAAGDASNFLDNVSLQ